MIFRKPYAFFIRYFKLINFIIAFLFGVLGYSLNKIHNVLNAIYIGTESNYETLSNIYIGFFPILIIILIQM